MEFAKDYVAEGKSLLDSAVDAARVRFRPIIMTSLAFTPGVVPLAIARGPSAAMVAATVFAIFFVPAFFVFVLKFLRKKRPVENHDAEELPAPAIEDQSA